MNELFELNQQENSKAYSVMIDEKNYNTVTIKYNRVYIKKDNPYMKIAYNKFVGFCEGEYYIDKYGLIGKSIKELNNEFISTIQNLQKQTKNKLVPLYYNINDSTGKEYVTLEDDKTTMSLVIGYIEELQPNFIKNNKKQIEETLTSIIGNNICYIKRVIVSKNKEIVYAQENIGLKTDFEGYIKEIYKKTILKG